MTRPLLQLLGRPGCHLCDAMLEALVIHAGERDLDLRQRDVDSQPLWQRRWGLKIPVLLDAQDEPVCITAFDADAFDAWWAAQQR